MAERPVSFDGQDFKNIPNGDLDPLVLPANVAKTDGTTPFTAPQGGVAAATDSQLTTLGQLKTLAGAKAWQGPVVSQVAVLPGSPATGDRHLLTTDGSINEWSGVAWVVTVPAAGYVTYVVADDALLLHDGSAWDDASEVIDHGLLQALQGGTAGQHYHLTAAQHTLLTGAGPARQVIATPAAGGAPVLRDLDAADVKTGQLAPARGGTGVDSSAASGYAKVAAGTWGFQATIPWADITGAPSSLTPTSHSASHGQAGSDAIAIDASQIGSGLLDRARGGLGVSAASLAARLAYIAPAGGGAAVFRALVPDDITGATAALQVLMRNALNTANVWQVFDTTTIGAVPTSRLVSTSDYLAGGGALNGDLTLSWLGFDIESAGSLIARQPKINFLGTAIASVVDDPTNDRVNVTINGGGEANTATNAGLEGISLIDSKVGVDLRFRAVAAASNKITVVYNAANKSVRFDVDPAQFAAFVGATGVAAGVKGMVPAPAAGDELKFLRGDGTWAAGGGGSSDHSLLTNLSADDHPQYHNDARGDLRYSLLAHVHTFASLTSKPTTLAGYGITDAAALVHGHPISDVTGLQAALDGKSAVGHGHAIADTTGLQAALDGKAPTAHAHAIADTTGLQAALDAKVATASNTGTVGVGVFKQKTLVDLEFYKINPASNKVSIALSGTDRVDIDINEANLTPMVGATNVAAGTKGVVPQPIAGDDTKVLYGNGTWQTPPGATGGEANTTSNAGAAGVGIVLPKSGVNLPFKAIKAGAGAVVTDSVGDNTVAVAVNPQDANLILATQVFG